MCIDSVITSTLFLESGSLKFRSTLNCQLYFLGWIRRHVVAFFNNAMGFSMLIYATFVYFAGNSDVNYISLKVPTNVNAYVWALKKQNKTRFIYVIAIEVMNTSMW